MSRGRGPACTATPCWRLLQVYFRLATHKFAQCRLNPMATPHSKVSSGSFDEFNSSLQGAALKATRHALSLPADLAFHRSMDSELAQNLDAFSARVLSVTNDLLTLVSTADSTQSTRGKGKLKLESQDDVVDNFQSLVVDAMDLLLERAVR